MLRPFLISVLTLAAAPAVAQSDKELSCAHQAEVVNAVRQARLDNVKERGVTDALTATEQTWPEKFNAIIPIVTPWIYELSAQDVRDNDLAEIWKEGCLSR